VFFWTLGKKRPRVSVCGRRCRTKCLETEFDFAKVVYTVRFATNGNNKTGSLLRSSADAYNSLISVRLIGSVASLWRTKRSIAPDNK
jgi:hypothetical protein